MQRSKFSAIMFHFGSNEEMKRVEELVAKLLNIIGFLELCKFIFLAGLHSQLELATKRRRNMTKEFGILSQLQ